jgi:hypothetical protein
MTERSNTMTTSKIDWKAAARVAGELGIQTRELVWQKDAERAREFALTMATAHNTGDGNAVRACSYLELAVLLGYSAPPSEKTPADDKRLAWIERHLTSMDEKVKTIRDTVARIVAEHDQAQAAAEEGKASDAA